MTPVDPLDTLRVHGGPGLSRVDSVAMALAVGQYRMAGDGLGELARATAGAASALFDAARLLTIASQQSHPLFGHGLARFGGTDRSAETDWLVELARAEQVRAEHASKAAACQRAGEQLAATGRAWQALAEQCQTVADRLQRAAGIYEHAESAAARGFNGLGAFVPSGRTRGIRSGAKWALAPVWGMALAGGAGTIGLTGVGAHLATGGRSTRKFGEWLVPAVAPHSARWLGGLSERLAGLPGTNRSIYDDDGGATPAVTVASRMLLAAASAFVPATKLVTTETRPGSGALLGCPAPQPEWQGAPSVSVASALGRVGDLHPFDPAAASHSGNQTCGRAGLPVGTIAIEKVTHDDAVDEPASWVVLIPGTQGFAPGEHAFDGVTDLALMAGHHSQVHDQVLEALAQVGAKLGEPVVLVGHSLGGIGAVAIAASPQFQANYTLGAVVTAGSPTATFEAQAGVPYLHLENDEELVSNLDGLAGGGNPASPDRLTVTRQLAASTAPEDVKASKSLTGAHPIETHLRTLDLALDSGNAAVHEQLARIEPLLSGHASETRFFTGRRLPLE